MRTALLLEGNKREENALKRSYAEADESTVMLDWELRDAVLDHTHSSIEHGYASGQVTVEAEFGQRRYLQSKKKVPGVRKFAFDARAYEIPIGSKIEWEHFPLGAVAARGSRWAWWLRLLFVLVIFVAGIGIGTLHGDYVKLYALKLPLPSPPELSAGQQRVPFNRCGYSARSFSFLYPDLYFFDKDSPVGKLDAKGLKKWKRDLKVIWHPDKTAVTGFPQYMHHSFSLTIDKKFKELEETLKQGEREGHWHTPKTSSDRREGARYHKAKRGGIHEDPRDLKDDADYLRNMWRFL
ncbi:uncharacterized protein BDZ99DRAFT_251010 [Mytilinidion resinicola]|uniref:J domain-containing protein n=1 Tax=Mytilinidion resinicola TaxID=574789 RepID=A0A6A6YW53_9PEZI|nr:uncharacterized protein BDZ99DRAFT_251010 [Mytilinidion resinicola]KAF2813172.1 hypothetical protein BDZ99DRAFT_251010 [Mytilinidion resinicola]